MKMIRAIFGGVVGAWLAAAPAAAAEWGVSFEGGLAYSDNVERVPDGNSVTVATAGFAGQFIDMRRTYDVDVEAFFAYRENFDSAYENDTLPQFDDGRKMGEQLMDEGADIIMPVAGPVGLGTLAVMEERGSGMLIGVDNDWSLSNPDKAGFILSNAMKNMDVFVTETIGMVIDGSFKGENWIGNLENGGVGISYGSELGDTVPAELKAEIEALIPMIQSGEIATLPEGVY